MALKVSGKGGSGTQAKVVRANGNDAGQAAEGPPKRAAKPTRKKH